jgi:signal transduction histidine kinase
VLRSTTFRFAALVFLLQVAAAAAMILGIGVVVRTQLAADAARTLSILRDDLAASYDAGGTDGLAREIAVRTERRVTPGAVMLLVDARGVRLAGNLDVWPPSMTPGIIRADATLYRSGHAAAEPMHLSATRLRGGERLLVGQVATGERRALHLLAGATLIALPLALIFAAAAAWAAARLIVGRLQATLAALAGVAAGELGRRTAADPTHDAFATLDAAVNAALDRVETLVTELRVATDGLAHDLKSPLTRMRAALERAAAEVTDPAAATSIERALAEADRLFALVRTALSITRAEAGIGRESFAAVDLAVELADIAEIYAPLVEEAGRTIRVVAPTPCVANVHRDLLAQALGNLIDNALTYGAGPITLSLDETDRGPVIAVADRGPGIPPARREQALRRFGRLDDARSGAGAGLGLTLGAAVARLHGGSLELGDADPGLIVRLSLSS